MPLGRGHGPEIRGGPQWSRCRRRGLGLSPQRADRRLSGERLEVEHGGERRPADPPHHVLLGLRGRLGLAGGRAEDPRRGQRRHGPRHRLLLRPPLGAALPREAEPHAEKFAAGEPGRRRIWCRPGHRGNDRRHHRDRCGVRQQRRHALLVRPHRREQLGRHVGRHGPAPAVDVGAPLLRRRMRACPVGHADAQLTCRGRRRKLRSSNVDRLNPDRST
mmetsp:Transcript_15543/g.42991  ORF Transcript_15543/g.42991 Transcript_15543/m.42991 type:complete len:218 (+) Transcript_15543:506-1159(+)